MLCYCIVNYVNYFCGHTLVFVMDLCVLLVFFFCTNKLFIHSFQWVSPFTCVAAVLNGLLAFKSIINYVNDYKSKFRLIVAEQVSDLISLFMQITVTHFIYIFFHLVPVVA